MSVTKKIVVIAAANAHVRERFAAALEGVGHDVRVAATAADLAAVGATAERLDLVVADLAAPGGGVELLRDLRARDPRVPIVVLSGSVASAAEARALAAIPITGYVNEHAAEPQIVPALTPHLFPDNFNRRGSARVSVALPLACRAGATVAAAVTLNLSKGGLAIRTMTPLDPTAKIHVRFRLPGADRDIETDSRVAWSDQRLGMGLQFERVDARDQAAIDDYVDRHSG